MYGLIRHQLLQFATSTLPWAVQLRNSCDTISIMGVFSESDFAVLTNTLNQDLSNYIGPYVVLVVSSVDNAEASATQWTFIQLPTPYALTRSGDYGGHIQRGISRILRARAYLDLLPLGVLQPFPTRLCAGDFGYGSRCFCHFFHKSPTSGCRPIAIR
jgi:hypothetical protein